MTPEVQNKDAQNPPQEKLELKYCEGCGALTMRATGSDRIYCRKCALRFAQIAVKSPHARQGGAA